MASGTEDASQLQAIVNHFILPPKLPQEADSPNIDWEIARITRDALYISGDLFAPGEQEILGKIGHLLSSVVELHNNRDAIVDGPVLQETLKRMVDGQSIAIKVAEQNAAVLVTIHGGKMLFEAFELSAKNEATMATSGRLLHFAATVSETLATLSRQAVSKVQVISCKSKVAHDEIRDTPSPFMVCGMFIAALSGCGVDTEVSTITKRIRDDVLWHNTKLPWRRSPMWLMLRVSIELSVRRAGGSRALVKKLGLLVLAHCLSEAMTSSLSYEVIHLMTIKIARRCYKVRQMLKCQADDAGLQHINAVLDRADRMLSEQWALVRRVTTRQLDLERLRSLDFRRDSKLHAENLDQYIDGLRSRAAKINECTFEPHSSFLYLEEAQIPILQPCYFIEVEDTSTNLHEVERWIFEHAQDWSKISTPQRVCEAMHRLALDYHHYASRHYKCNPEAISIMILALYYLWICCDAAAVRGSGLLAEYECGIPEHIFVSFLLPTRYYLEKLLVVENYLDTRKNGHGVALLFADSNGLAYPARYFDQSRAQRDLKEVIESRAIREKAQKCAELAKVQSEYYTLTERMAHLKHEQVFRWQSGVQESVNSHNCCLCELERQRERLRIDVHEWPLPTNPVCAKTVVFELKVPESFAHWRLFRQFIIYDVLEGNVNRMASQGDYLLSHNDPHLTQYYNKTCQGQHNITLGSHTKPAVVTHYRKKRIADLSAEEVCVPNGLTYTYIDSTINSPLELPHFGLDKARECTYRTGCGVLQDYLLRPSTQPQGIEPNHAITDQYQSLSTLSCEEFRELATMTYGLNIQWYSITVQLLMPAVNLNAAETLATFLQCINQAGPRGTDCRRTAHIALASRKLLNRIHATIKLTMNKIKHSWRFLSTMQILQAIAKRCLSLGDGRVEVFLDLLREMRSISLDWCRLLIDRDGAAMTEKSRKVELARVCTAALTCASTFDIDSPWLDADLSNASNVSVLVEIVITLHDYREQIGRLPLSVKILHLAYFRTCRRAQTALSSCHEGLDGAVLRAWGLYSRCSPWEACNDRSWLTCQSRSGKGSSCKAVHLNVLTGELLVNGQPLNTPPRLYTQQTLFKICFPQDTIEVLPGTTDGFEFSLRRRLHGHTVELGLDDNGMLIIRASIEGKVYETIPTRLINGYYPPVLQQEYVHWYSYDRDQIHFRPKERPWTTNDPDEWIMVRCITPGDWCLRQSGKVLLPRACASSELVCDILKPLSREVDIHISFVGVEGLLDIDLVKVNHQFALAGVTSSITSRQHPDLEIMTDQTVGTLYGLENQLHLGKKEQGVQLTLIPKGTISHFAAEDHVKVTIDLSHVSSLHTYRVDELLGCLVDLGDTDSKLDLAYLHALTSHHQRDPLTDRTGTEQALGLLSSPDLFSVQPLSDDSLKTLGLIENLTPRSTYYPDHLRVMQTMKWNSQLGSLAQHNSFATVVRDLLHHAERMAMFHRETQLHQLRSGSNIAALEHRNALRCSRFHVSEYGAEVLHTACDDVHYKSREHDHQSTGDTIAILCALLYRKAAIRPLPSLEPGLLWNAIRRTSRTSSSYDSISLSYDAKLADNKVPTEFLQDLPALITWLRDPGNIHNKIFEAVMFFAAVAASGSVAESTLQALILHAHHGACGTMLEMGSTDPRNGTEITAALLERPILDSKQAIEHIPEWTSHRPSSVTPKRFRVDRENACQAAYSRAQRELAACLARQWPSVFVEDPEDDYFSTYFDMRTTLDRVQPFFNDCRNNLTLFQYLQAMEMDVRGLSHGTIVPGAATLTSYGDSETQSHAFISARDIFFNEAPDCGQQGQGSTGVAGLLASYSASKADSEYERQYRQKLIDDNEILRRKYHHDTLQACTTRDALLVYKQHHCEARVDRLYEILLENARSTPHAAELLLTAHFPRLSLSFYVTLLRWDRWQSLTHNWRRMIMSFCIAITELQHVERLILSFGRHQTYRQEKQNTGHQNWDPMDHPETVLMEIRDNFLVRAVQQDVGMQMISPPGGRNLVTQLNMGEGKSSVIIPLVAAQLADGCKLMCVVVGKPQSKQMMQMLIAKLGGFVNRRIWTMPFVRSLQFDRSAAEQVHGMLEECVRDRGILLLQPEHLLSLKLMSAECHLNGKSDAGRALGSIHQLLHERARILIDESDHNLCANSELVYTQGTQHLIDGAPDRWIVIQEVLDQAIEVISSLREELPDSIETHQAENGEFPRTRMLDDNACKVFATKLADRICDRGLRGINFSQYMDHREDCYAYITEKELDCDNIKRIEGARFWRDKTKIGLLTMRALLAHEVLAFALGQRRWRVDYGLTEREPATRLAVPYTAKDRPSARSVFAHPDVMIVFTLLSYYYAGLTVDDLRTSFAHLLRSDQANAEYAVWVKHAVSLPLELRDLEFVNMNDDERFLKDVAPALCHQKAVIDYFCSNLIFRKECQEFTHKLSASSWDLVERRQQPTTGFSGTADLAPTLPTSITHEEMPSQKGTDAMVIDLLLHEDNAVMMMEGTAASPSSASRLIEQITNAERPIQVVLDAGAQILELGNLDFATAWLTAHGTSKEAVIFVDDNDDICVINRLGVRQMLQMSPYASHTDVCLVFLDQSHTRGIDLKLPAHYRAALTLGKGLTKDKLAQAAMRMRLLGLGQSITFVVPGDIKIAIRITSNGSSEDVTLNDILRWTFSQTHAEVACHALLSARQGLRHGKHAEAWRTLRQLDTDMETAGCAANALLEQDALSLVERYHSSADRDADVVENPEISLDVQAINSCLRMFEQGSQHQHDMNQQQERELHPDMLQELVEQPPPLARPRKHSLHNDVREFARRGLIVKGSTAYEPAFCTLCSIEAAKTFDVNHFRQSSTVWVSADFAYTVEHQRVLGPTDRFQRSVCWLLVSEVDDVVMAISPFEANALISELTVPSYTSLRLFKPRYNSAHAAMDTFDFGAARAPSSIGAVSRKTAVQLALFAGQLYYSSYEDYKQLCAMLGLYTGRITTEMSSQGWQLAASGFITSDADGQPGGANGPPVDPVEFIRRFITQVRRDGASIDRTELGDILSGSVLLPEHFDQP